MQAPRSVSPLLSTLILILLLAACGKSTEDVAALTIDYPREGSVFPPEFLPPTFLWHDPVEKADRWVVRVTFAAEGVEPIVVESAGEPPPEGEIDPRAIGGANKDYEPPAYQRSAHSWTPESEVWARVKESSVKGPATVTITGFARSAPDLPLSRGAVTIRTSKDPVGAPIFYRDVPLMPSVGEAGKIAPLDRKAVDLIAWRLRDISRPRSKVILKGMKSCGNCHSFSLDGKTLGMDVDGPSGDKGMYAVKDLEKNTVIGPDDVITWNSFPGKLEGHKTIGFLSRISPDGKYVVSTVNESLFVTNFEDFRFLQVFYPTRGILAYYSRKTGEIRALPGADDPEYVHCDPAWLPDGSALIFARARARDPYPPGQKQPRFANDPNELLIRYDLYRIPFDGGAGGKPEPVEGASANGMSNTFPKVSPDGKWIVFVKCRNGQLMRPDSRLFIVPVEGGEAREMRCNTPLMNSWHSFSPNSRWMVFSSKSNRPFTQAFLTHIDEEGNDTPAILVPNCTADNRAVNLPEFLNDSYEALDSIDVPVVRHHLYLLEGNNLLQLGKYEEAIGSLVKAIEVDPDFSRAHLGLGVALAKLGRHAEAAVHFARATDVDPENVDAFVNLGHSLMEAGLPTRAAAAYEHAVKLIPAYGEAREGLARARKLERTYEEEIRQRLESGEDDAQSHYRLALLYDGLGRDAEVAKQLALVIEHSPKSPGPLARLAWLLATSPDPKVRDGARAVELAKRALALSGEENLFGLDILAAALAESRRYEEAVATASRCLGLARLKAPAHATEVARRIALYRQHIPYRARR